MRAIRQDRGIPKAGASHTPWSVVLAAVAVAIASGRLRTVILPAAADCLQGNAVAITQATIGPYSCCTNSAMSSCSTPVRHVIVGSSVLVVGDRAFQRTPHMTSIVFPNTLTVLGDNVLTGCPSLQSVSLPTQLRSIPSRGFSSCSLLASINFPATLTEIQAFAFFNCSSLMSATFPSGLAIIGTGAFQ